jgi:hypothetical protein
MQEQQPRGSGRIIEGGCQGRNESVPGRVLIVARVVDESRPLLELTQRK